MKFAFFGSPRFAHIILSGLIKAELKPDLVITNPDRPSGREKIITPSPVKELALENKIEVCQPEDQEGLLALKEKLSSYDFALVAAYAHILPKEVLDAPKLGTLGLHPSSLPKYRGASPIQSALLAGDEKTAVSIYQMDEKLDHGPILHEILVNIDMRDDYLNLEEKLAEKGTQALISILPSFMKGSLEVKEQEHDKASYTKKFETRDGEIDVVSADPIEMYRKIKALNPEPGAYTFTFPGREGKRVKLLDAKIEENQLIVTKIKPEGKSEIEVEQSFNLLS
ncbi:MAG: methionyl-tRNA formyltransferase [Candidatus Harrisonbacteria bacterium]|nr:methionyl-tRNA formyltransferase [Candidatus Harrisonbacteria bacterium]